MEAVRPTPLVVCSSDQSAIVEGATHVQKAAAGEFMTTAESLLITAYLLIVFGGAGIAITLANSVLDWIDRRVP